jgi:branched-chain amino acid aminotransferase
MLASLDGAIGPAEETRIPVTDEGLTRGDGAFEVMRLYGGRPFALAEHVTRLERTCAGLRLEFDVGALRSEIDALLGAAGPVDALLRVVLTRGGRRILTVEPLPARPPVARVATVTYAPTRVLDGLKTLSYAANMLAGRLARERGFDEALLVTPHGRVLEAPTSSIFWVDPAGTLNTPPLSEHILASITRQRVMDVTDVSERPCTLDDLREASEAFLASTTREAQSIAAIEDFELPEGERTREVRVALRARIEDELAAS